MSHHCNNRRGGCVKIYLAYTLFYMKADYIFRNIYKSCKESARQAVIMMMLAWSEVPRVVHCSVAIMAVDYYALSERVNMQRSEQNHGHIDTQQDPGKGFLPASNANM